MRAQVDESRTFREFLGAVNNTALDAFAHDEVPFERLVETVRPERDVSRNPLFDVMVVLHDAKQKSSGFTGLRVEDVDLSRQSTIFDIVVSFEAKEDTLAGQVEYSTDLFDATTIHRMVSHLEILLSGITKDPDRPLGEVLLLSETERHQVLVGWNDTDHEVASATFPELFEAQVARTPDLPALLFDGGALRYSELEARANRLAHLLIQRGAGPERIVALALPRSVEIVVAQLAVVKAGAAFLPVDPAYPQERIEFMLADAEPVLVITLAELAPRLPQGEGVAVLVLDGVETVSALRGMGQGAVTDADRVAPLLLTHPAYVIYTSGSTGRPKG
ncbi:MAG: AMP-binding protein, partial [Actinobacteria bacterium]|nr:AMP-binding protein [Actinomycetota bacterium]